TGVITSTTRMVSEAVENDPVRDPGYNPLSLPNVQQALAPKPRIVTAPIILASDDKAGQEMVAAAYQGNGSIFVGFDPVERLETWRTPLLSDKYYDMGVTSDADRVYIADGGTLTPYDRNNGKTLWQNSLANNLQTGCEAEHPCLQQVTIAGQG